jgi:hypothetical protein
MVQFPFETEEKDVYSTWENTCICKTMDVDADVHAGMPCRLKASSMMARR